MIAKTSAVDTRFLDVGFRIRENHTGHTVKNDATSGCWNIIDSHLPRPDSWMSFLSLLHTGQDSGNVFHNEMLLHGFPRHKMICNGSCNGSWVEHYRAWMMGTSVKYISNLSNIIQGNPAKENEKTHHHHLKTYEYRNWKPDFKRSPKTSLIWNVTLGAMRTDRNNRVWHKKKALFQFFDIFGIPNWP